MKATQPEISAVVCTRNRGKQLIETIESILANRNVDFELLIIDQSTNDETNQALQPYLSNPRLRYIQTATQGAGLSRNIGLHQARAEIVAYTDDDCQVSDRWLSKMLAAIKINPKVAIVFCSIEAGPHNTNYGAIPTYEYRKDRVVQSLSGYFRSIGMAAGMAVRKQVVLRWGGFDPAMGPGSVFRSAEDHDLALRTLGNRWWVYELAEEFVIHNGFRTFEEYELLTARDWFAIGAAHAKFIRRIDLRIVPVILFNLVFRCFLHPIFGFFRVGKIEGGRRLWYYIQGIVKGIHTPIDQKSQIYCATIE